MIFFRPPWWGIIGNPYFIARRGLYCSIKKYANTKKEKKLKILDIGCGDKPYQLLFNDAEYIGIDITGGGHLDTAKQVDEYFDGKTIPMPDESFDIVICTQVLEHVEDSENLLMECHRVLKKDGELFLTMPFVWNEHETPFDFRRFTRYGHEQIFGKAKLTITSIESTTGVFRVCGQILSAFIFETLAGKWILLKFLVSLLLCFPIQAVSIILDAIFRNSWITLDYVVHAKKI